MSKIQIILYILKNYLRGAKGNTISIYPLLPSEHIGNGAKVEIVTEPKAINTEFESFLKIQALEVDLNKKEQQLVAIRAENINLKTSRDALRLAADNMAKDLFRLAVQNEELISKSKVLEEEICKTKLKNRDKEEEHQKLVEDLRFVIENYMDEAAMYKSMNDRAVKRVTALEAENQRLKEAIENGGGYTPKTPTEPIKPPPQYK